MKILIAGASGYGNAGDDAYKELFTKYLPEHELMFDSPYPDVRMVKWCDYLIIGGGGLIYNNKTLHQQYMSMYLDEAIKQSKKFSFVSCGIQPVQNDLKTIQTQLQGWKKYLEQADVITVRGSKDKEVIDKLIGNDKTIYAPDLCYLIEPVDYHLTLPERDVFIFTGHTIKDKTMINEWNKSQNKCILTMSRDDVEYSQKLANSSCPNDNIIIKKNLSPREIARVIKDARSVYTGRYHGHVFARAVGQKNIHNYDKRYKSVFEQVPENKQDAIKHIEAIKVILDGK
jgi:polysaccharide pyruvyl transferase WcaK-like protein